MSKTRQSPSAEALYELFCQVRPFPRERMDWIAWLMDEYEQLRIVMSVGASGDRERQVEAARRLVELSYGDDARGSTPWGSWRPPTSLLPKIDQIDRAILFEQLEHITVALRAMSEAVKSVQGVSAALRTLAEAGLEWFQSPKFTEVFRQAFENSVREGVRSSGLASATFHAHLDGCAQCRLQPLELCEVGRGLLEKAAH